MGLTLSVDKVDESGREILTYGTADFPAAFFDDDLSIITVPPHWHDEFEIVLITEGKVRVRISREEFYLSRGEGYFANSGILHTTDLVSQTGHQHAMVFSPKMISCGTDLIWKSFVAPVLGNPHLPFIRLTETVPWQKEILSMAEVAWQYGAYEKSEYPIHVRYLLSRCIALIAGQAESFANKTTYSDKDRRDELRIKKALLFIDKNYGAPITLDEIAASASASVSTCLRLFSVILGTTPGHYLQDYRLQKAVEELQARGDKTISEIAYLCGFTDASYFNRCFRKKYGVTPTEYLQRQDEHPTI